MAIPLHKRDFILFGGGNVNSSAVIGDNQIVRGDGGSRGIQGSGVTISDVSGNNVSLTATTGNSLTLATLDGNKNVVVAPHGTGILQLGGGVAVGGSNPKLTATNAGRSVQLENATFHGVVDNTIGLGYASVRWSSLFLGSTGIKLGDGTNGPTITATGTSPNQDIVLTHAGTGNYVFSGSKTPASAAATGAAGSFAWDADYIYIATAADTWKRVAIATW